MKDTKRPTIADFVGGTPYSTRMVAAFFGTTKPTIANWIKIGTLKARRIEGSKIFLIDGSEVRRLYGAGLLEQDRREAKVPSPGDDLKRAKKARRELDKLAAAS